MATTVFSLVEINVVFYICGVVSIIGVVLTLLFSVELTRVSLAEHDAQLELFYDGRPEAYKGKLNAPEHLSLYERWTGRHGEYDPGWVQKLVAAERAKRVSYRSSKSEEIPECSTIQPAGTSSLRKKSTQSSVKSAALLGVVLFCTTILASNDNAVNAFTITIPARCPLSSKSARSTTSLNDFINNGDGNTRLGSQEEIEDGREYQRTLLEARQRQRRRPPPFKKAVAFKAVASAISIGLLLLFSSFFSTRPDDATAADYGSLSEEQKVVAEAWRLVDNSFLDRTFNGQDWFAMRQDYVKNRKYKTMDDAHKAIETMVSSLGDKYTKYLPPAKYQSIVDTATGTLKTAGVGVEIAMNKDGTRIIASDVEDNSPAKAAGIRPNDVFVEVDGARFDDIVSTQLTPDDVALKLRGPEKSKVGVVMERDGQKLDFILTREPITITAVKSYLSNVGGVGKVGVIRIKSFSGTTAATVTDKLNDLKKKGASAFVLDLRGNPGGLLPGGVDTASLFLDANKPVVFVVNKNGIVDSQSTFGPGIDLDSPVAVLVDHNTASAAEVFTAAMKENSRATVVGENTFGKGIVQTVRSLSDNNGGVAITVARYETPQHHDINKQGIPVDIPSSVECPKDDATACLPKSGSVFQKPKEG